MDLEYGKLQYNEIEGDIQFVKCNNEEDEGDWITLCSKISNHQLLQCSRFLDEYFKRSGAILGVSSYLSPSTDKVKGWFEEFLLS